MEQERHTLGAPGSTRMASSFFSNVRQNKNIGNFQTLCDVPVLAFAASRLFNIDKIDDLIIKKWVKTIREQVAFVITQDLDSIRAAVSCEEDLGSTSNDMKGFCIEVWQKKNTSDEEEEDDLPAEKSIYQGYLLSRGRTAEHEQKSLPQLPLLICRQHPFKVIDAVHVALQQMFDCQIHPLTFTRTDLMWMWAITVDAMAAEEEDKSGWMRLDMGLPQIDPKASFELTMSVPAVSTLWERLRGDKKGDMDLEDVAGFLGAVHEHVHKTLKLKMCDMTMKQVITPVASFSCSGKMVIRSPGIAELVARFLVMQLLTQDKFDVVEHMEVD